MLTISEIDNLKNLNLTNMIEDKCCVVTCDRPLDQDYWENQYQAEATGWDLGEISPPIKSYIDTIQDKEIRILIPGCGNAYEAEYLLQQGFTHVTIIDIAPTLVQVLQNKFANNPNITIILGDFFELKHTYDLILEQTFFCALPPTMRQKYVWKMHQLLSNKGILAGLLFNRDFEVSPPFGGNRLEYDALFKEAFAINSFDLAKNSMPKRLDTELFFEFQKVNLSQVHLYRFEGITCSGCKSTVTQKYLEIEGVRNVSMNNDFSEILIVSTAEINLEVLQEIISYDPEYKITKF